MKKKEPYCLLEIKNARSSEETPEALEHFLENFIDLKKKILPGIHKGIPFSLEIVFLNQIIHFLIAVPKSLQAHFITHIETNYPKTAVFPFSDGLADFLEKSTTLALGQLKLAHGSLYPLKTHHEFTEHDSLMSLLGILTKAQKDEVIVIQYLLKPINTAWQKKGMRYANQAIDEETTKNPHRTLIMKKTSVDGFKTAIRIAVHAENKTKSIELLHAVARSFSAYTDPQSNRLVLKKPLLWQTKRLQNAMATRSARFMPNQILTIHEIATMYHFPTQKVTTIPNLSWYKTILSEPPENLPVSPAPEPESRADICFFAETMFKNQLVNFGIKTDDRRRHMYIIGKTGTGKTTLVSNLAINDMRNNSGICIIDPHGDLCENILEYIPQHRISDIVYLDPSDLTCSFSINPMEAKNESEKELVVSGIVAIFHKLYGASWGPRLEHILRNTLMTAIHLPNATLLMIPELLTNDTFRAKTIQQITDPVLKSFWEQEFEHMQPRLKNEAISPILNKVGQFTTSRFIRNIIQNPTSTVNLEELMNDEKIILMNLSQGKIGEDNAALLGAMIITKLQLAAMNRVNIPEEERKDFYLYVDEFQNFATDSFIKILSEARKYRLNLILANQYIAQIPEDVKNAIFGNVGTLFSFLVGASDASFLAQEFKERYTENDLLALENYQAMVKMMIDASTQAPFICRTTPLPPYKNNNKSKALEQSRRRYMRENI